MRILQAFFWSIFPIFVLSAFLQAETASFSHETKCCKKRKPTKIVPSYGYFGVPNAGGTSLSNPDQIVLDATIKHTCDIRITSDGGVLYQESGVYGAEYIAQIVNNGVTSDTLGIWLTRKRKGVTTVIPETLYLLNLGSQGESTNIAGNVIITVSAGDVVYLNVGTANPATEIGILATPIFPFSVPTTPNISYRTARFGSKK